MSASDIFLKWVFPMVGGCVGTAMFTVPMQSVLRARRERVLGDLNPLPFPAQTANTVGWIAYSYVISTSNLSGAALVYWPNAIGLLLGLFFTMSCYGLADTKTKDRQLAILLFFAFILSTIGACGTMAQLSPSGLKMLWGFTSNAILLIYYAAPLSTILHVMASRCSATLHLGLAIMQLINGGAWVGYGIAVGDAFIWAPNAVGCVTGSVLLALIAIFPRKAAAEKHSPAPSEAETSSSQRQLVERDPGDSIQDSPA